jgi:hypothetical protein
MPPLIEHLREMVARPGGLDDLEAVATYIMSVGETLAAQIEPLIDQLGPEAKETWMTTADMLRAEGEARGEARGEALTDLLREKFRTLSADVVAKVRAASVDEIRKWNRRVLTAKTIDDVFA